MDRFMNWIEKHKKLTFIIGLLIFAIPLIIVQFLFKWQSGVCWLESGWEAGDLLSYIAGFETLLATSILSYVALSQTQKIKKSEEFSEYGNTKRPFFIIDKVTIKEDRKEIKVGFEGNRYKNTSISPTTLYVYLKNIGDGIANECSYEPYGVGEVPDATKPLDCILVHGTYCIPCRLVNKKGNYTTKTVTVNYQNILGFRYKQLLIINAGLTPLPCGEDYINMGDHIERAMDYDEGYTTYINLISAQMPIGFADNLKQTKR
jgi:hypothetical protein